MACKRQMTGNEPEAARGENAGTIFPGRPDGMVLMLNIY
jgi:hypothetical protein